MEVILLERVARLGQMGDVVRVKDGFARNFLLPRGKALRATTENRTRFEIDEERAPGASSQALKTEATGIADKSRTARASPCCGRHPKSGQLFGSVSPRDLVGLIARAGYSVNRNQIALNTPIKTIGQHNVPIALHPEIETAIKMIVARNADEAARIARGEDVTQLREEQTEAEAAVEAAEAFFEPEAAESRREPEAQGEDAPAATPAPSAT